MLHVENVASESKDPFSHKRKLYRSPSHCALVREEWNYNALFFHKGERLYLVSKVEEKRSHEQGGGMC